MADKIQMTALGQNQNLINPVKIQKIEPRGKPPGFYKSIILDAIGVASAFFVGYVYFEFLKGSCSFLVLLCAFLLFVIAFTLEALLGNNAWRQFWVLVVEVIALFVFFYTSDRWFLIASMAIAFVFLVVGYLQCRSGLNHGTTIQFFKLTNGVVGKTVTAMILAAIILYIPTAGAGTVFIGEAGFNSFFNWAAGLVGNFYPNISIVGSFSDFTQSVARQELASSAVFQVMSPSDQNAAILVASTQIEGSLSRSLNITPSASSSTSDVAYNAIEDILRGWYNQSPTWFWAGWGLVLFLILRSIGVFAVWVIQFLTMIVYELLLSMGAIRITEEPQTKETIKF